jgi:hypothetical protein
MPIAFAFAVLVLLPFALLVVIVAWLDLRDLDDCICRRGPYAER